MIEGDDLELFERSIRHAAETSSGDALDAALDELGWVDALSFDTRAAVSSLFEHQGRANVVSASLDRVLTHGLGIDATAIVLPAIAQWSAPGVVESDRVVVRGLARPVDRAVVVARTGDGHVAFDVDLGGLERRPFEGMDPTLGWVEVTGSAAGGRELGPVDWRAGLALGQLALGQELLGGSRRMLELARGHALDRVQFGRPIAMFQAVRHRLAETYLAIETAQAMLDAAWLDPSPETAAMAKASAGRGARTAAKHCQQVLAGIGFTKEHPFHRYALRVFVLEQVLGATKALTKELGDDILRRGQLPALLPL